MSAFNLFLDALSTVARPKKATWSIKDAVTGELIKVKMEAAPTGRSDDEVLLTVKKNGITSTVLANVALGKESFPFETVIGEDAASLVRMIRGIEEPETETDLAANLAKRGANVEPSRNGADLAAV